jgi:carboxyl-terminal processing protease
MKYSIRIFVITLFLNFAPAQGQLFNEEGLKFMKLFEWIKSRYVDTINIGKFSDDIIRESLHKLDPHSVYFTRDEVKEMNEPLEGNFEGIGVNFNILNDTLYIVSVIAGGPSEKVGIKAGDRIIKIDGENIAGIGLTNKQVTTKLKGKKGTIVNVLVKRKDIEELVPFAITRDKIPIYSIDAVYTINSNTGYIKLSRFSHTTLAELNKALTRFKKEKINNLIVDLSGNGGGYFDVAISMSDEFLEKDKLIVFTQGAHAEKKEYFSTSKGSFEKGKLVVIIDEGSASASEIFAGAIQDWDRGVIVGRRSFGKGLVQSQFIFPDESVVRLTIARYYTPVGRLIQKSYNGGYSEYSKEVHKRFKHGELINKDSIHFPDSLKYYTMIRKRKVYGGGGIMPDIFIPIDTTKYSNYYRKLLTNGIINKFVIQYVDKNRESIKSKYPDFKTFKNQFEVDTVLYNELIRFAEEKSIAYVALEFDSSKQSMANLIKASIARNIWSNNEFIEIFNENDSSVQKALEVINNWDNNWGSK